jgi:hypothetical protein
MTTTPFRKATVAMIACAFGAILLDTTPAHAQVGVTHCGGDACAQVVEESPSSGGLGFIGIDIWTTVEFTGHFELQTPEHTTINTRDMPEGVNGGVTLLVQYHLGKYCFTAWKEIRERAGIGYEKIGGACFDITS